MSREPADRFRRHVADAAMALRAAEGFVDRYSTNAIRIYNRLNAWVEIPPPRKDQT